MAPADGPACGLGGGGAFTGMALEYPNAWAISGGSASLNRREKKARKAKEMRFMTCDSYWVASEFQDTPASYAHLVNARPIIGRRMRKRHLFGAGLVLLVILLVLVEWQ